MEKLFLNKKLEEFKATISNKKIAILGLGISNLPLAAYLAGLGCDIAVFDELTHDKLAPSIDTLKDFKIEYHLGTGYLNSLKGYDVIFKTPKIRHDIPQLLSEALRGAVITSEMDVFLELCPSKVYGITGSDGKTTTTSIIHAFLDKQGYKCWLGGNIGTPLLDKIDSIMPEDRVILELSSFQLQTMKNSPKVAVITNISPNHLDVHKSYEEYIEAKKSIFRFQSSSDMVVLNYDNKVLRGISDQPPGKVLWFSRADLPDHCVCVQGEKIVFIDGENISEILDTKDILLPGLHNLENYLAAITAVIGEVEVKTIKHVANSFKGVEHRIELFAEYEGVRFYNDSIATSPTRTIAGLNSFKDKVILIVGGKDKHLDFTPLGAVISNKVKSLVLVGETAEKIENSYRQYLKTTALDISDEIIPINNCEDYSEAVRVAFKNSRPGDVIILSPASTSFDRFKNFEERGNKFKEIVKSFIDTLNIAE